MSGWRHPTAGHVDRTRPVRFFLDGRPLEGFAGDTLASALLASGERVLGRSFKYRRPRGLWGMGGEEPNALFDVTENGHTTPNVRATSLPLREGMALRSVNTAGGGTALAPSLIDLAQRFLPAGFYYKTFMAGGWMRWEPMIRRMAGLGRLDPGTVPVADAPAVNIRCDVLVIGGGPAGLAAARAKARQGAAVWLVDEAPEIGGSLRWRGGQIEGADWHAFQRDVAETVASAGGRVLPDTSVWGAFDHGLYAAWERRSGHPDRHWRLRARDVVLATGAIERPLWFANNDLPGVMSAEAALHHLSLFGAVAGRRVVVATTNDSAYFAAEALAAAGCRVTIADTRQNGPTVSDGVAHLLGASLQRAHGSRSVGRVTLNGGPDGAGAEFDADTILVSGGWTPSVHLHCQAGGKLDWRTDIDALVPRAGTSPLKAVGAAAGTFGLAASLQEGHRVAGGDGPAPRAEGATWHIAPVRPDPTLTGRQWVDLQNDVTVKDVALAAREGYRSVEHLKRYTTLGMATDQGRTSNFAGLAAMAALTGRTIPETGTTTYRPPFAPVPLGVIGGTRRGERFAPLKRLPLEAAHRSQGALMREYGWWLRPAVYGEDGLDENAAADDEARVARERVGLYDASPLGKIEVLGPGAAELMDFCGYIRMSTLAPGRARYGLMLNETGVVHDDGVVLRLAEDRFILSASSSHVASVRLILEEARQDRFDPSRVVLHDVTDGWVTLTVTGPRAGAVLASAGLPEALCDDAALPHMGVVETRWAHGRLRVTRVSFTGDRSYELSVPARHGRALHAVLDGAVTAEGGRWIGLEAVLRLRAEKGYILIGKDTDGITMPHDLGWTRPREKRSDEFFGRRALFTPEASRPDRRQLVGLSVEGAEALPVGAHVVPTEGARRSLGFVTSSGHGPGVGRPVALAMIEGGRGLMGARVDVFHLGAVVPARIEAPCAFDPAGKRLHA